jgi:hypothetical protein
VAVDDLLCFPLKLEGCAAAVVVVVLAAVILEFEYSVL